MIQIPKNNHIDFKISLTENFQPISPSLNLYLKDLSIQKDYHCDNILYNNIYNIVNPFTFIYTNIPGYDMQICKNKYISNIFFELIEIINNCNIFDTFYFKNISILHLTPNHISSDNAFTTHRECFTDNIKCGDFEYSLINDIIAKPILYDLIFFEINNDNNLIIALFLICICQQKNGNIIIKVSFQYHKLLLDVLYILSSFYDKVHLAKPSICDIIQNDTYIICKGFLTKSAIIETALEPIVLKLINYTDVDVISILSNELPNYFVYKIEEFNIIIGQQQIVALHTIINLIQFNNDDKLETLKKLNIQKCIAWCDRNKIQCNNLIEKSNIFLMKNKIT